MQPLNKPNSLKRVAMATMIGTAIEYFDNYIYTMAAVLIFNHQFFHAADPLSGQIAALSTLALTFIARPLGAVLFGHFGDRLGRKNTFVMSLLIMGISTVVIGLLPTYDRIGIWATILLCLCRIGQGIGLGGEWGGAALVAIENAPEGKRGWYGTFPQLGAPLGLLLANGVFLLITALLGQAAMADWAWRIPFLSSFVLVAIGLYVRLKLTEAPIFIAALNKPKPKALPMMEVIVTHFKPFFLGMLICMAGYVLFYIMIAFSQIYAKSAPTVSEAGYAMGLGFSPQIFTALLMCSAISLAITIAISGKYIDYRWTTNLVNLDDCWRCSFWFSLTVFSRKWNNFEFVLVLNHWNGINWYGLWTTCKFLTRIISYTRSLFRSILNLQYCQDYLVPV